MWFSHEGKHIHTLEYVASGSHSADILWLTLYHMESNWLRLFKVNDALINGECQVHVWLMVADCTIGSWHNWYFLSSTPRSCDTTWCTGKKRRVQFLFPRLTNQPSIWAHRYRSITSSCCNTASYTRAHAHAQFFGTHGYTCAFVFTSRTVHFVLATQKCHCAQVAAAVSTLHH